MKALVLEGDNVYPGVVLDPKKDVFEIQGKSVPEDPEGYYEQILDWLNKYEENPNQRTVFNFRMEYFNVASSKRLLFIIYKLNEMFESGTNILIQWYYHEEEDDMYEVGQDFAFMVNIPFDFISFQKQKENPVLI